MTVGILAHRFFEDLFRLCIAAIGHIHFGLGDRVDIISVDRAHSGLAKIGEERRVPGIDLATRRIAEHGVGFKIATPGHDAVFEARQTLLAASAERPQGREQTTHYRCRTPAQIQWIGHHGIHEGSLGLGCRRRFRYRFRRSKHRFFLFRLHLGFWLIRHRFH